MRHTGPMKSVRRGAFALAVVASTAFVVPAIPAGAISNDVRAAQQASTACSGVIVDAAMSTDSIPGGEWVVEDACIPAEAAYETEVLGYRLAGGLGVAAYADGHLGRIAFLTARVAPDRSLTFLGVEDVATGAITWAYADGAYGDHGGVRTGGGAANAVTVVGSNPPGMVEPAHLELSLTGSGTDLADAQGPVADQVRALLDQALDSLAER